MGTVSYTIIDDGSIELADASTSMAASLVDGFAIAALGDSIVPILLDYLTPANNDAKARHLAGNSARVLAYLEPATFIGSLLDLLHSKNKTSRSCAIYLLGCTRDPAAAVALAAEFRNMSKDEVGRALTALTNLGSPAAAGRAVALMDTATDSSTRRQVMTYLAATAAQAVRNKVLANLIKEEDDGLLEYYIEYFE